MIGLFKTYMANIMGILIRRNTLNELLCNFQLKTGGHRRFKQLLLQNINIEWVN